MRLPSINFSLTRSCAIEPLLNVPAIGIQHRVAAVFMSAPLFADAAVHLSASLCKAGDWATKKVFRLAPSAHTLGDAGEHLKIAAVALLAAVVAPMAGPAAPRWFCQSLARVFPLPPMPPAPSGRVVPFPASGGSSSSSSSSATAVDLINRFVSVEYLHRNNLAALQREWSQLNGEERTAVVCMANRTSQAVRDVLAQVVYVSAHPIGRRMGRACWPMSDEAFNVEMRSWRKDVSCNWNPSWPLFYHATQNKIRIGDINPIIRSILKDGAIRVSHQGRFPGAFISTRPEVGAMYGYHVFAFRQTAIQYLSQPMENQQSDEDAHWTGFSKDIPVSKETVACIFISDGTPLGVQRLQQVVNDSLTAKGVDISEGTIPVFSLRHDRYRHSHHRMIPREWIEQLHREQGRAAS